MSDFYGNPIGVMARKTHRCNWCGETINKGDSYVKRFFVCDGEAWTAKMHAECDEAHQSYDYDGESICFLGQFQRGHNHEPGDLGETAVNSLYRCPGCVAELEKQTEPQAREAK